MNAEDYREKSSGFLLGKEFIIVLVIVFSGLSFTLGFFVGKNTHEAADGSPLPTVEATRKTDGPVPAVPAVAPPSAPAVESAQLQPGSAVSASGAAASETAAQPVQVQDKKQPAAGPSAPAPAKAATAPQTASSADDTSTHFTVQLGAFRNPADARKLKARFEKKGYKPYIAKARDAKGHDMFKVKTGDFPAKKDAEVLALKLRKTEGLHTYVTSRTE